MKKFLVEFFPKYALDEDGKDVRVGKIFAKVAKKKDLEEKKLFGEYVKLAAKKLKIGEIKEEILGIGLLILFHVKLKNLRPILRKRREFARGLHEFRKIRGIAQI